MNWKVRLKNPVFWAQAITAIVAPILTYLGLNWSDMTSWGALAGIFVQAVQNPVILVSVAVSLWGIVNDPTTAGFSDSARAMTYDTPAR